MRIAIISNFYPPYYIGGYELACHKVAEELRKRGHKIFVATTNYGFKKSQIKNDVWRIFGEPAITASSSKFNYCCQLFRDFLKRGFFELRDGKRCQRFLDSVRPDIIYLWNTKKISLSVLDVCRKSKLPICYYVFDHHLVDPGRWLGFWMRKNLAVKFSAGFLDDIGVKTKPIHLKVDSWQFATRFLKDEAQNTGLKIEAAKVIYYGIDMKQFPFCQENFDFSRRLLFVGQVVRHKGVHTAIEALNILINEKNQPDFALTIAGPIVDKSYYLFLRELIAKYNLNEQIKILNQVEADEMPGIYKNHGLFIFPSIWEEPYGITILEAMASGLVVIGTATGGSAEILMNNNNSLVFSGANAEECADRILEIQDTTLRAKLRERGRKDVLEKFNFSQTIEQIEKDLLKLI